MRQLMQVVSVSLGGSIGFVYVNAAQHIIYSSFLIALLACRTEILLVMICCATAQFHGCFCCASLGKRKKQLAQ